VLNTLRDNFRADEIGSEMEETLAQAIVDNLNIPKGAQYPDWS
jgi:hypothetical protein